MSRIDAVVASSAYVRIAVVTCVLAAVPVILGFQLFASHLGQTSRDVVIAGSCQDESCMQSAAVVQTVADLEAKGFSCRTKPGLTDSVIFEWKSTEVTVVDFATSLKAASNDQGWVRRYCMPLR
jgi:hypothetical protein